ncbi:MAG: RNA polymerase sigma factor [Planctomycetota bacterium]
MAASDADLVMRVWDGDVAAFEALVHRHIEKATAVAHSVLGPDAAADDVVQNAFFKAYEQLGTLSEPAAFPGWLLRIVRNEAISWYRRHKRRGMPMQELVDQAVDPSTDPIDRAKEVRKVCLRHAYPRLSKSYREILALKYEAGLDYEQLAETLGTSVANVEKRLYRARQALLKGMERAQREFG